MANYYCTSRTNYFKVKDEQAFRAFASKWGCGVITKEDRFGLLSGEYSGDGSFPSSDPEAENEDDQDFEFWTLIAPHLADKEIGILEEAGAEKLRYVSAFSVAFNNQGECVQVGLNDIYALARETFGDEASIVDCAY